MKFERDDPEPRGYQPSIAGCIEERGGTIQIGANIRNSDLAENRLIRRGFPVLSKPSWPALPLQLRNMASTGGTSCNGPAALTFGKRAACNKRAPGSGCDA